MQNSELKFIVDLNAGKMARWLRMAGFDADLFTGADDDAIVAAALTGNRILLTRDRRIMKHRAIVGGRIQAILIEDDHIKGQVLQILDMLKLDKSRFRPFTRCLECNRQLTKREKETIRHLVPPYVYQTQNRFAECPGCRRIYWPGTHWEGMSRKIDEIPDLEPDKPR